jgi:uncharacterized membrane protein
MMKKRFDRETLINTGFYVGLAVKAANALVELAGGLLMIVLNHERLNRLIRLVAFPELREDPSDIVMNYLISVGKNLSMSSQHSIAAYMILHGSTKLLVIWMLFRKKMWAYPVSVAVFGLFIAYEIYSYVHSKSVVMLAIIIIDALIILLIVLEYMRLKSENKG